MQQSASCDFTPLIFPISPVIVPIYLNPGMSPCLVIIVLILEIFWTIYIIILVCLFFYVNANVSFLTFQASKFRRLYFLCPWLFVVSSPRKVLLLSHSRFPDWSIDINFPNIVAILKWILPINTLSNAATIEHVLESWTVIVFNAHPLYACLYCSLYWN